VGLNPDHDSTGPTSPSTAFSRNSLASTPPPVINCFARRFRPFLHYRGFARYSPISPRCSHFPPWIVFVVRRRTNLRGVSWRRYAHLLGNSVTPWVSCLLPVLGARSPVTRRVTRGWGASIPIRVPVGFGPIGVAISESGADGCDALLSVVYWEITGHLFFFLHAIPFCLHQLYPKACLIDA
jgi:hypothetical protein